MQAEQLDCASGQYSLLRPGAHPKQPLRAWDAADEYLINHLHQIQSTSNLIILNDQFGALACAFHQGNPVWLSDSFCAKNALEANFSLNNIQSDLSIINSLEVAQKPTQVAAMKIPKNTSYLDYQLQQCFQFGVQQVYLAGMMKHLPKTLLNQLQQYGKVTRLPFVKKATIFVLTLSQEPTSPYPKQNNFLGTQLLSHANVFGRDKLDPGAQFFLENLNKLPEGQNVADLCCGSGILGIKYAMDHPSSHLSFFDESYMAVESTRQSWQLNQPELTAEFIWEDGLGNTQSAFDLILCNPPFHEAHTVGDHIAKRLFKQSKKALTKNGSLIVVGNRHLQYHQTLKKTFSQVEQIASNPKFVLLKAHG